MYNYMQDIYYLISKINGKLGNVIATGACWTASTVPTSVFILCNTEICLAI